MTYENRRGTIHVTEFVVTDHITISVNGTRQWEDSIPDYRHLELRIHENGTVSIERQYVH